jgi:hypothetical protein
MREESKDPVPMQLTLTAKSEFNTCFPFEHRTFELERDPSTPGLVPRPCAQDDGGLAISNCIVTAQDDFRVWNVVFQQSLRRVS